MRLVDVFADNSATHHLEWQVRRVSVCVCICVCVLTMWCPLQKYLKFILVRNWTRDMHNAVVECYANSITSSWRPITSVSRRWTDTQLLLGVLHGEVMSIIRSTDLVVGVAAQRPHLDVAGAAIRTADFPAPGGGTSRHSHYYYCSVHSY